MPDISMCSNHSCPSKEDCFRYKATPGRYQSYADFAPPKGEKKCDYFMEVKPPEKEK
jgi:hypothetical protein